MIEVRPGRIEIGEFVVSRIPGEGKLPGKFEALGAYRGDRLIGGFLYTNFRPIAEGWNSIDMHMAGGDGWLTRRTLRAFYAYPFLQLDCSRVVGSIRADNTTARHIAEGMGFKLDGTIRSGISPERDTCVYTMTRAE
jgi:RimJ/RimL family protein N-acetyltransferase